MPKNLNDPLNNENRPSFLKSLPKPQRIAFLSLSVISLGIIVLWVWQFNNRLSSPFYIPTNQQSNITTDTSEFEIALLNFDTDSDGLTDTEERSLYGTSPYLEDTDSDGISDREEIENGTDPNCATGQDCSGAIAVTPTVSTTTIVTLPSNDTAMSDSGSEDNLQLMMSGQADVAQLRALLLDSGADATMLQQLSDEELLKAYQEMLAGQETSAQ
ncbi:MAG: thrombospondin type 3 repeat-containing protein [Patescibacteria group bacterium]|nr:thrombospondin type 3 repeat-containing protein [Patescibacteria group bacterium]